MIPAGKLKHRLKIYYPDREQDSTTGEMETTWTELGTYWGSWEPYSTKDFIAAASVLNQTSVRAVVRYTTSINAGMRVYFRSKYYEIVGPPLPDKETGNIYMTLMLAEVVNV